MYFKDDDEQFIVSLNKSGKSYEKLFTPRFDELGLDPSEVIECNIRLTKLSSTSQPNYLKKYGSFEKTKQCSYFVYRNGACSDTSFIPFDGVGGFRPTDCPQMRGEVLCNNDFDSIINPASNKSVIRPNPVFEERLRCLSSLVRKDVFKKVTKKPCKQIIEGKEYLVLPNQEIWNLDASSKLGEIKCAQVRWDKLTKLKTKEKKELMTRYNNTTPLLSETILTHSHIKAVKDSEFRLHTANPESDDIDDIHIISKKEYKMVENNEIESAIFDDKEKLQKEQYRIHLKKIKNLYDTITRMNYSVIDTKTNTMIDLSTMDLKFNG